MATGRYDNIKVHDGTGFKNVQQVKVYDGTSWVDYGAKDSYNDKKICANSGFGFKCFTYVREDVSIPNYIEVGKDKYINLQKSNYSGVQPLDTYKTDYILSFDLEVYASTSLYTIASKNSGNVDIGYNNFILKVDSNNQVALTVGSRWKGNRISDGKAINEAYRERTTIPLFDVGERIQLEITKTGTGGKLTIKVTRANGNIVTVTKNADGSKDMFIDTLWVASPTLNRVGSKTTGDNTNQTTFGKAYIYSYTVRTYNPSNMNTFRFYVNVANLGVGSTKMVNQTPSTPAYTATCVGTSVVGASYTVYNKQTI